MAPPPTIVTSASRSSATITHLTGPRPVTPGSHRHAARRRRRAGLPPRARPLSCQRTLAGIRAVTWPEPSGYRRGLPVGGPRRVRRAIDDPEAVARARDGD